jgi:hypothetical protein
MKKKPSLRYRDADNSHKRWVKEKHEKDLKEKTNLMHDILDQIDQKRMLAEFDNIQQKEEDEEIRLFNEAKTMLKQKRKQKEKEIQSGQQEQRRLMVQNLEKATKDAEHIEQVLLENYTIQKYKSEDSEKEAKSKKLELVLADIKNHRNNEYERLQKNNKYNIAISNNNNNNIAISNNYNNNITISNNNNNNITIQNNNNNNITIQNNNSNNIFFRLQ